MSCPPSRPPLLEEEDACPTVGIITIASYPSFEKREGYSLAAACRMSTQQKQAVYPLLICKGVLGVNHLCSMSRMSTTGMSVLTSPFYRGYVRRGKPVVSGLCLCEEGEVGIKQGITSPGQSITRSAQQRSYSVTL